MTIRRTNLFIDRTSFTLAIPTSDRANLHRSLNEMLLDDAIQRVDNPFSELLKSYRYAYVLPLAEGSQLSIQVEPRDSAESTDITRPRRRGTRRYLRIEWNPHAATTRGGLAFDHVLRLLARIISSFNIEMLLQANITRMDLTFDVLGVHVDRIDVFTLLRRTNSVRYKYGPIGMLNSTRLGLYGADKQLLVYDKSLEQRTRQIEQYAQRCWSARGPLIRRRPAHTRFELQLRDIGPLEVLGTMANPFATYTVRTLQGHDNAGDSLWPFFLDSCRLRGIQAALSRIPDRAQRDKLRRRVQMLDPPSWWNPQQLWQELPAAIAQVFGVSPPGLTLPDDGLNVF